MLFLILKLVLEDCDSEPGLTGFVFEGVSDREVEFTSSNALRIQEKSVGLAKITKCNC